LTGNLTIPDGVTSIGDYAFAYCHGFNGNLTIGSSVQTIGWYAFYYCGFNGNLTIGSSVQTIGRYAFAYCSGFTAINALPTKPPTLGTDAFNNVSADIPVYVSCGSFAAYNSDWGYFTNFIAPVLPTTLPATNITRTAATLNGTTTATNGGAVIAQGFLLKEQGSNSTDTILVNNSATTLTYNATNLSYSKTYYVKTFCTITCGNNIGETFYSAELPFTTLAFDTVGAANKIYDINDLLLLAQLVEEGNCYSGEKFILMNDIILPATPNNIKSIGRYSARPFCGEFDGNNKRIYNVYIDEPNTPYQGFFGYAKDAEIHNLGLNNITASGRNYTGGMFAYAENSRITDCYVHGGTLYALNYCGGLIGYQTPGNNSVITRCYNDSCTVTGNNYVGGLLGYSDQGTVRNSYVAAIVTGNGNAVGAIVGGVVDLLFYQCYFNDSIVPNLNAIGAHVDHNHNSKGGDSKGYEDSGLSSSEMRTQAFVDKINMGLPVPAWKMDYSKPINNGFPILVWQTNQPPKPIGIEPLTSDNNNIESVKI
jgi:hypothetical protein